MAANKNSLKESRAGGVINTILYQYTVHKTANAHSSTQTVHTVILGVSGSQPAQVVGGSFVGRILGVSGGGSLNGLLGVGSGHL